MCEYEYDMGNEKFKAVLIRNMEFNTYLTCRIDNAGHVSGIGAVKVKLLKGPIPSTLVFLFTPSIKSLWPKDSWHVVVGLICRFSLY